MVESSNDVARRIVKAEDEGYRPICIIQAKKPEYFY